MLHRVKEGKAKLETIRTELAVAMRNHNYQRAGELQHGVIPQLEKEVRGAQLMWYTQLTRSSDRRGRGRERRENAAAP